MMRAPLRGVILALRPHFIEPCPPGLETPRLLDI
jgi:hypothetical protein